MSADRGVLDGPVTDALAVYRLTRLVVEDVLTEPLREKIIGAAYRVRYGPGHGIEDHHAGRLDEPKIATLITCPWCASVWVAAGVVVVRRVAPTVWSPVARLLAFSAAAGMIAVRTDA